MELICPSCHKKLTLKQSRPYHAGFSNLGFLYCDECPTILEFSTYNPEYVAVVGDKHPWELSHEEKQRLEQNLAPCPNGGRFRFNAQPRCPHCGASLAALVPDAIHFIELGDVIDGDRDATVWLRQREA